MYMHPENQRGFTLVEMIIVIVITGIIGGMVAMFIRAPVQGYVDSARRAEMTDIADTALRRIGRDVRAAVPNSVRLPFPADSSYFEFLPTRDGGRYRSAPGTGTLCNGVANNTNGDALDFSQPDGLNHVDTCFEIIGRPMDFVKGDAIVVGSTQSDGSLPYKTAASGGVTRIIADPAGVGTAKTSVTITSTVAFPASSELDGHRFEVVPADQQAVTYACINMQGGTLDANGDGQGTLTRYWKYNINQGQPVPPLPIGVANAILASNVSDCHFVYDTSNQRNSLLAVRLTITRGRESVNLYHEIHVNNIP
jgi:MSHA biogenesis protein MshO